MIAVNDLAHEPDGEADTRKQNCKMKNRRVVLAAAKRAGADHFVLLSAICVQRPKLAFQRAKLAFEAELMASGIDYTVVRATAFFKSLAGQVSRVQQGKPFLLFGDGRQTACKPIGEQDLARFLVGCWETTSYSDVSPLSI